MYVFNGLQKMEGLQFRDAINLAQYSIIEWVWLHHELVQIPY